MDESIDIRALRARLSWTQDQMAEYLGVDRSSISRIEKGSQPLRGPLRRLLRVLGDNPEPVASAAAEEVEMPSLQPLATPLRCSRSER